MQLQKKRVPWPFAPCGASPAGGEIGRWRRGSMLLYCRLFRHPEGRMKSALACCKPLCKTPAPAPSHTETQAKESSFCCLHPCFFFNPNPPPVTMKTPPRQGTAAAPRSRIRPTAPALPPVFGWAPVARVRSWFPPCCSDRERRKAGSWDPAREEGAVQDRGAQCWGVSLQSEADWLRRALSPSPNTFNKY